MRGRPIHSQKQRKPKPSVPRGIPPTAKSSPARRLPLGKNRDPASVPLPPELHGHVISRAGFLKD